MCQNYEYRLQDMKIKLDIETIDNREVTLALKDSKTNSFIDVEVSRDFQMQEGPPDQFKQAIV